MLKKESLNGTLFFYIIDNGGTFKHGEENH